MKWRCTGCGDQFDAAPPAPDGLVPVPPCGHRVEWEPVYPWDGEGPVTVESIRAAMERIPQAPVVVVHPDDGEEVRRLVADCRVDVQVNRYVRRGQGLMINPAALVAPPSSLAVWWRGEDGVVHDLNHTVQVRPSYDQPDLAMDLASWRPPARHPGESAIDAAQRVLATGETIPWSTAPSYRYGADTNAFDSRPEHCWRCDAKGAETDVGLCSPCHEDLRAT
jgi:hypothetical protein